MKNHKNSTQKEKIENRSDKLLEFINSLPTRAKKVTMQNKIQKKLYNYIIKDVMRILGSFQDSYLPIYMMKGVVLVIGIIYQPMVFENYRTISYIIY